MDSEIIPSYKQKLAAVLSSPDTIENIFDHVANGGDLISFCQALKIRYSDLASWITSDNVRLRKYSDACDMGKEWTKQRIMRELSHMGTFNLQDVLTPDGQTKPINEWPEGMARAIAGVTIEDIYEGHGKDREHIGEIRKVKLVDKIKALELTGRELGMFKTNVKVERETRLEDLVGGSFEEASPAPSPPPPIPPPQVEKNDTPHPPTPGNSEIDAVGGPINNSPSNLDKT
jgi:hypothetical protein